MASQRSCATWGPVKKGLGTMNGSVKSPFFIESALPQIFTSIIFQSHESSEAWKKEITVA
jgi:hypothetical protein